MRKNTTIMSIEELYRWACENGVENFTVFTGDEGGMLANIDTRNITINSDEKTVEII